MQNRLKHRKQQEGNHQRPSNYTVETKCGAQIRPELVNEEAQREAEYFKEVSDTQLRRFYSATIEERKTVNTDNQAKVVMALLNAKAHYAASRSSKNKPLAEFFKHHANIVVNSKDFNHFIQHFEAIVAYHKYFGK